MISITRLAQAQKNLEQDLKRVYESAYKSIESGNPDEEWALFDLSEEELLEVFIRNGAEEDFTEDELGEFKDEIRASAFWKVFSHLFRLIKPLSPLLRSFPKVGAFLLTFSYDCLIHPILFSSWHWNDYGDIDSNSLGLSLSSNAIYDELKKCNPDVVSVFLSNLDNCSIADREMLQETYNSDQKELFVNKLKTLSITDYNRLVYVTSFSHFENAAISFDIDTLRILFHHIDFGEDFKIDLSFLPEEDMFDCIKVDYWKQFIPNDDATEDEVAEAKNKLSDKIKSSLDHLLRCFSALKYEIPRALESLKPFPFERILMDDVLSDPKVKSILDGITANPFENDKTPDGQKRSNAGAKPKTWIKVSMTEEVIKKKLEEEVWTGIVEDIKTLVFSDKSDKQKESAYKVFGAAFMFYSAYSLGLTVEKKYSKSAERAFSFLPGPKTSVNEYLDKLHQWYTKLYEAQISHKGNIDNSTFKQWKRIDKLRAEFIINNFLNLNSLFDKTKFLLGKAFGIETGIELKVPKISSDPVLGGALRYDDNVGIKNDGHQIKTGLPLSYSDDEK